MCEALTKVPENSSKGYTESNLDAFPGVRECAQQPEGESRKLEKQQPNH